MIEITEFKTENGINAVLVKNAPRLDIFKTFDCGQCFRFDPVSVFGNEYEVGGVAFGKYFVFAQGADGELSVYNATKKDFDTYLHSYLDFLADYAEVDNRIISVSQSEHMKRAVEYGSGIRILRQNPWECMISFIISQNNNIPRIKKIINSLCKTYGEKIEFLGNAYFTFPTPEKLADISESELAEATKMGFRAKYVLEAAKWVLDNPLELERLAKDADYVAGLDTLCQIKGIGPKVASCILLFGLHKTEAFPIDVHIKRTLERYFPNGLDIASLGETAGIAQQYLFYYEKYNQST